MAGSNSSIQRVLPLFFVSLYFPFTLALLIFIRHLIMSTSSHAKANNSDDLKPDQQLKINAFTSCTRWVGVAEISFISSFVKGSGSLVITGLLSTKLSAL